MHDNDLLWKIGQRIKKIREEKGISQIALAGRLKYEKSNMSRLESGRVNPRISTLYDVAKALDISLNELLKFD